MQSYFCQRLAIGVLLVASASGCVGMAIGAATDAAIEVGKVPFKVGGAVVDVVRSDKDKADEDPEKNDKE